MAGGSEPGRCKEVAKNSSGVLGAVRFTGCFVDCCGVFEGIAINGVQTRKKCLWGFGGRS